MSAVAVSFDPRLEMGMPRSPYSWPVLEAGSDFVGHELAASVGTLSDASMTPPSIARSLTNSPPKGTLTPEQRELKRQRDQARRDTKSSMRARRALSNSSRQSTSPPVGLDYTSASAMPIYTTAPSQISLLAEPVTSVPDQHYMPAYAGSPMPDQTHASLFTPFPALPPSNFLNLDYAPQMHTQPHSHHHFGGRPSSLSDPGMMYSVPQVLPSGATSNPENGHVRVVQSRPKPQCWEHGCNGRQFSTFSNLLRHQREKSGQAAKATCPNCGAEFTRTTARNGHLAHDKCKSRRNS